LRVEPQERTWSIDCAASLLWSDNAYLEIGVFMKYMHAAAFTLVLVALATSAKANLEEQDFRELPFYCEYRISNKYRGREDVQEKMRKLFGQGNYIHLHHYCFGINFANKAEKELINSKSRHKFLALAVGQFDYVLGHWPDDFALKPEALWRKGKAYRLLGQIQDATATLIEALRIKPDYVQAWLELTECYIQTGNVNAGREVLAKGLAILPESSALKAKLATLDAEGASKTTPRRPP
jgi:tetratricopeptide (TPR) repeat protein